MSGDFMFDNLQKMTCGDGFLSWQVQISSFFFITGVFLWGAAALWTAALIIAALIEQAGRLFESGRHKARDAARGGEHG